MKFDGISAVLLAAGESRRMGQPKMLLPWGETTVLGQVVATFAAAGLEELLVVTGGARQPVERLVAGLANRFPVRTVFNPAYVQGEMLGSIQAGLAGLGTGTGPRAALVGLGDQPQVRASVVRHICDAFSETGAPLIIPSFQNHRGHPWLLARPLWKEFLALPAATTPRAFLQAHAGEITYLTVEDDSILQDVDTPADYDRQRP